MVPFFFCGSDYCEEEEREKTVQEKLGSKSAVVTEEDKLF